MKMGILPQTSLDLMTLGILTALIVLTILVVFVTLQISVVSFNQIALITVRILVALANQQMKAT